MRISDWSSDVCSSDLRTDPTRRLDAGDPTEAVLDVPGDPADGTLPAHRPAGRGLDDALGCRQDRKSVVSGKSVSVRVDLGGRRIIKKQKQTRYTHIIR